MANSIQHKLNEDSVTICFHIVVTGFVQGVGFRPFVFRLANELGVKGVVSNNTGQVSIIAEADKKTLELFCERLLTEAPLNAKPTIHAVSETQTITYKDFSIIHSHELTKSDIHIQPDLPVCEECLEELLDKNNRRYRYPFINCTQCGPRYSIINSLPYDRKNTSMQSFKLCCECEKEYLTPHDRRFHAEPIACEKCGPVLTFIDDTHNITNNALALDACIEVLKQGKIVSVKGVGGYHLMCDATSSAAISLLRRRKQRSDKPFAVLMTQSQLELYVDATQQEISLLQQSSRPIVLVRNHGKEKLPANLTPGFHKLGVMLPNNPLHFLLSHHFEKPLVATSANIAGEPIIIDNENATKRLAGLCDAFLHHNRDIIRPADDPVMLHNKIQAQLLRTGRGLAPTEFTLPFTLTKTILAVGGHSKNTLALAWENSLVISSHNGDLGNLRSYQTFEQAVTDLQNLYQVKAKHIICDAHPDYASSEWAQRSGLPVAKIFHHHAHASSLALENPQYHNFLNFCWDGVGLGEDGTLWGGETFLGHPGHWQRVASFKPFLLPGGEKTSREAWRIAASLCWHTGLDFDFEQNDHHYTELNTKQINPSQLKNIWDKKINSPQSSAVGRLFSAAASLLGLIQHENFEGHGPMLLEALAESATAEAMVLPVIKDENNIDRIDWTALLKMLKDKKLTIAYRARCFHETLAESVSLIAIQYSKEIINLTVGLSGGVFQNQLLVRLIRQRLEQQNIRLVLPVFIPVNDGGLCAGQIIEYHYQ